MVLVGALSVALRARARVKTSDEATKTLPCFRSFLIQFSDFARVVKWQTRTFEGRMPKGMGVQVPPRALIIFRPCILGASYHKLALMKLLAAILLLLCFAAGAHAVTNGQVDTFQDGTTMGWSNGLPANLVNIDTGGPAGAGDRFLTLSADGTQGHGGRLTTFNLQQWLGNYIAQGITGIGIDLRNQGTTTLSIRLAFKSQNAMSVPGYLSAAVNLQPGSGWQHFTFSIAPANMIAVGGPSPYNTFFSTGIGDVRFINEVGTTSLNGDPIAGQVGIDNIRAVPEPSSVALWTATLIFVAARRWRHYLAST
jgi:hypothetical protein